MRRPIARTAALVAVLLAVAAPAEALFDSGASTSAVTFGAATLQPTSNVQLAWRCPPGTTRDALLTWPASTSSFVQGYLVERLDPATGTVLSSSTTTATSHTETGIAKGSAVEFRVTSVAYNWRSSGVTVSGTAPAGAGKKAGC